MKSPATAMFAGVLSALVPGGGQLYNGQRDKAMLTSSLLSVLPMVFVLSRSTYHFSGFVTFSGLFVCLYVWNIIDAILHSAGRAVPRPSRFSPWMMLVPLILLSVDAYGLVRHLDPDSTTLGVRPIRLATNSMAPTAQAGDFIMLATRYKGAAGLTRGAIVTFHHQALDLMLFKRLIAVAGDRVEGLGTFVKVNGKRISEPYAQYLDQPEIGDDFNRRHSRDEFGPLVVPEGKLFVLGDNRRHSYDSRDPRFGFIDTEDVYPGHKPLYVYWSREKSRIGRRIE